MLVAFLAGYEFCHYELSLKLAQDTGKVQTVTPGLLQLGRDWVELFEG